MRSGPGTERSYPAAPAERRRESAWPARTHTVRRLRLRSQTSRSWVGVIPWSPLTRGILASTVRQKGSEETTRARTDDLDRQWYDHDMDFEVALAWLIRQGVTAPIIGATRVKSLDEAVGALDVTLDDAEASSLEELYQPHTVLGMGR